MVRKRAPRHSVRKDYEPGIRRMRSLYNMQTHYRATIMRLVMTWQRGFQTAPICNCDKRLIGDRRGACLKD